MLRITVPTSNHAGLFVLQGRLTGLWAKELLRVARAANQGYLNTFDLQEVFFVDSHGEQVLRWLGRRGAKFITNSAYGKVLCVRLKLERVESGAEGNDEGKSRKSCCESRSRKTRDAAIVGDCGSADVNQ